MNSLFLSRMATLVPTFYFWSLLKDQKIKLVLKKFYFLILLKRMSFVDCVVDADYEIFTEYPHQIRRKSNKRIIAESVDKSNGYIQCHLNGDKYYKHRIIAFQFIPNDDPDNKTEVDHQNQVRTDNRVENLRWCTRSENNSNKSSNRGIIYEYVDELPEDFIEVIIYKGIEFDGYFYSPSENKFYFDNDLKFRIININTSGFGYRYFTAKDITGKKRNIYVDRWLRDEGLI